MRLLLAFLVLTQTAIADLKITHEVIGEPAKIEVQDLDNPQSIKKFNLDKGESKTISITGTKCKITVYAKGSGALKADGEFTPNQSVAIQSSGTKWTLKKVSK